MENFDGEKYWQIVENLSNFAPYGMYIYRKLKSILIYAYNVWCRNDRVTQNDKPANVLT